MAERKRRRVPDRMIIQRKPDRPLIPKHFQVILVNISLPNLKYHLTFQVNLELKINLIEVQPI